MALTESQKFLLVFWHLRTLMGSDAWARDWDEGLRKFGKLDGNRAAGRWRTFDSLLKLGLLTAPLRESSMYPDKWKATLTDRGREIVAELVSEESNSVKLPSIAREVWYNLRKAARPS